MLIEKDFGCLFMKCSICTSEFCWFCLQSFQETKDPSHFYYCSAKNEMTFYDSTISNPLIVTIICFILLPFIIVFGIFLKIIDILYIPLHFMVKGEYSSLSARFWDNLRAL